MLTRKMLMSISIIFLVVLFTSVIGASAQQEVKVGLIYPMTGSMASVGEHATDAIKLGVEIINNKFEDVPTLFAKTEGLPNLGGAKIKLVFANSQGLPELGRAEAERLISMEKVAILLGCYNSGVTKVASQTAERYKFPFLTAISTAPDLTERGLKYFFRITLGDAQFAENYFEFFKDLKEQKNIEINKIGFLYENTEWGVTVNKYLEKLAEEYGYPPIFGVSYPQGAADLDSEVLKLKQQDLDFLLQTTLTPDTILYYKTAEKLDYTPAAVGGFGGGYYDPKFVEIIGPKGTNYAITRDLYSPDLYDKIPLLKKVAELFKEKNGYDFDADSIRAFMAIFVIADAINRAGSTDAEMITQALRETDIAPQYLPVPWKGIKFDEKGQNYLGAALMTQYFEGERRVIWPFDVATKEIVYPMPEWSKR